MFPSYFMGVGGPANNFDPPHSYWAIPDPHGGGASTYTIPSGMKVSGMGTGTGTAKGTQGSGSGSDGVTAMSRLRPGPKGGLVFMMQV